MPQIHNTKTMIFIHRQHIHTKAKYSQKVMPVIPTVSIRTQLSAHVLADLNMYKDKLSDSHFPFCNFVLQKGRPNFDLFQVSHLALLSFTAALLLVLGYEHQYKCGLADC